MQALHVIAEAEHRRALRRVVAADALEDARAVVQAVDADVDLRVGPVDELAVHPDLLGLLHRRAPLASPNRAVYPQTEVDGRAWVSREARAARGRPCARSVPAPIQTTSMLEERPVDQRLRDRALRERRDAARLEARRVGATSAAVAIRTYSRRVLRAISASSARRSPGTSASTKAPSQTSTSDLTICDSSQPTAFAASRAVGVPASNSSIRASTAAAREDGRDALDGLGPDVMRDRFCLSCVTGRNPIGRRSWTKQHGRTEAVFREVNEAIAKTAERFERDDEADFVCECADPDCAERVTVVTRRLRRGAAGSARVHASRPGHEEPSTRAGRRSATATTRSSRSSADAVRGSPAAQPARGLGQSRRLDDVDVVDALASRSSSSAGAGESIE